MNVERVGSPIDIAVSGLKAQSARLNVIAANIANADARTESGEPYRRRDLVVRSTGALGGVAVARVGEDGTGKFKRVFLPGDARADKDGYVTLSNVELPVEMMHMLTATRAYQANAAVLKRFQDLTDATLELIR